MEPFAKAKQRVVACSKTTGTLSYAIMEMAKPLQAGATTGCSRAS